MAFFIINILLAGLMVGLSFSIDRSNAMRKLNNPLVNLTLTLGTLFLLMGLTVALCLWGPGQLSLFFGRITFMLMAWFVVSCCNYTVKFPRNRSSAGLSLVQWALNILAFVLLFIGKRSVRSIVIVDNIFQVTSGEFFSGRFYELFPVSTFEFFVFFYAVLVPFVTIIMIVARAENMPSRLERQRMLDNVLALLSMMVLLAYVVFASRFMPMLVTMCMLTLVPMLLLFVRAASKNEIVDGKIAARMILTGVLRYIFPAVIAGVLYVIAYPLSGISYLLFVLVYGLIVLAIMFVSVTLVRLLTLREFLRDNRYFSSFERDITSIDYSATEPNEINDFLFSVFRKYLDTGSLRIMVESGGSLQTIYSSAGDSAELPIDANVLDLLLSLHHPIVFRDWAVRDNNVSGIRLQLLSMLNDTDSDGFILLHEGRQIIGMIFLGKKISGNAYSDYDYDTFTRLYSNFFVIGYFMKNMMNEAVVGTVNREIRMSGQIITSIQENMDFIKNPKVDSGYLMVPAHNIGGEFVDTIRLNDSRYIYIIGALSGKGIAASMSMVILKSIIRTYLAEIGDFKKLVVKVNSFIRENLPKGTYFAGTFGLLDFNTNTMYYINCGSPALFMYTRAYNNVIEIQGEGHVLGFVRDVSGFVKVKKVNLAEGDIILTCTDGLIESRSLRGDVYGKGRIQNALMDNSFYPASKMAQFAYDSLVQFTSKELDDDVTILVLKYLGGK